MSQVARVRKPNVKDPEALRKVEVLASLQLEGLVMVRHLLACSGLALMLPIAGTELHAATGISRLIAVARAGKSSLFDRSTPSWTCVVDSIGAAARCTFPPAGGCALWQ